MKKLVKTVGVLAMVMSLGFASSVLAAKPAPVHEPAPAVDTYYFGYDAVPDQENLFSYSVTLQTFGTHEKQFDLQPGSPAHMAQLGKSEDGSFTFNVFSVKNLSNILDHCKVTVHAGAITSSSCKSGNSVNYQVKVTKGQEDVYNVGFLNSSHISKK